MSPLLLWGTLALVTLSFVEALHALYQGRRLVRRFREALADGPVFTPPVTLILPLKGVDPGLGDNLRAFFQQDYPDLRLAFVTATPDDPAIPVMERISAEHPSVSSTLLLAGPATARGQKVHNLLHALHHVRRGDGAVAFGDSDIRPGRRWLRDLVAPLGDPTVTVSTGFRWYVPTDDRIVSWLRSIWNAGILGLFGADRAPFAWGGALALRPETLDELAVRDVWRGALSDDYAVSRAVRERGGTIRFEPRCLSFTHEGCSWSQLLEWSHRQLAITRVYDPTLWRLGFVSEVVNNVAFWGGLFVAAIGMAVQGPSPPVLAIPLLVSAIYAIRGLRSRARVRAVIAGFPEHRATLQPRAFLYALLGPVTSLVTLLAFVRTLASTDIEWRGVRYRMWSPSQTEILETE